MIAERSAATLRAPAASGSPAESRKEITVLLVSDVRLLRDGLSLVLAQSAALRIVGSASTRAETEERLATLRPDVVLLDMSIPRCVEIGIASRAVSPTVGIVAFAVGSDEAEQIACVEAGVTGFVPRDGDVDDLVNAIMSVVRGEAFCSPQVVASTFRRLADLSSAGRTADTAPALVSAREREIVDLIDRGLSNKEIAQRLHIGIATVKNHVHNILDKLHLSRRGEIGARLRESKQQHGSSNGRADGRPATRLG